MSIMWRDIIDLTGITDPTFKQNIIKELDALSSYDFIKIFRDTQGLARIKESVTWNEAVIIEMFEKSGVSIRKWEIPLKSFDDLLGHVDFILEKLSAEEAAFKEKRKKISDKREDHAMDIENIYRIILGRPLRTIYESDDNAVPLAVLKYLMEKRRKFWDTFDSPEERRKLRDWVVESCRKFGGLSPEDKKTRMSL